MKTQPKIIFMNQEINSKLQLTFFTHHTSLNQSNSTIIRNHDTTIRTIDTRGSGGWYATRLIRGGAHTTLTHNYERRRAKFSRMRTNTHVRCYNYFGPCKVLTLFLCRGCLKVISLENVFYGYFLRVYS